MKKYLIPVLTLFIAVAAVAETKPAFDKADKDRNGILNKDEVAGIITEHEFNKADLNHDGNLSRNEYTELVQLEKRRMEEQS